MTTCTTTENQYVTKDPDSVLDYGTDWTSWLGQDEVLANSIWIVPNGITKTTDTMTASVATIWLSGGTTGETYVVVNRITTNQGRTEDRSKYVTITEH